MPTISGLGHVGLYCFDLEVQERFYTEVLGLTKTDEYRERGLVFLSAQPDVEHHELLLVAGRNVGRRGPCRPADLVPLSFARRRDRLLPPLSGARRRPRHGRVPRERHRRVLLRSRKETGARSTARPVSSPANPFLQPSNLDETPK